jgi:5-enolpyruvylshikimate-3-phosphate synthase
VELSGIRSARLGSGPELRPRVRRFKAVVNTWTFRVSRVPTAIDTYDDHRIAMCFSLVGLGGVPVGIIESGCVGKTLPDYFKYFTKIANKA